MSQTLDTGCWTCGFETCACGQTVVCSECGERIAGRGYRWHWDACYHSRRTSEAKRLVMDVLRQSRHPLGVVEVTRRVAAASKVSNVGERHVRDALASFEGAGKIEMTDDWRFVVSPNW